MLTRPLPCQRISARRRRLAYTMRCFAGAVPRAALALPRKAAPCRCFARRPATHCLRRAPRRPAKPLPNNTMRRPGYTSLFSALACHSRALPMTSPCVASPEPCLAPHSFTLAHPCPAASCLCIAAASRDLTQPVRTVAWPSQPDAMRRVAPRLVSPHRTLPWLPVALP